MPRDQNIRIRHDATLPLPRHYEGRQALPASLRAIRTLRLVLLAQPEQEQVMIDLTKYEGHSPGPWASDEDVSEFSGMHCIKLRLEAKKGGALLACSAHASREEKEEIRANGRLAVDAPKLLAEVVRLRADLAEAVQTLDAIERAIGMRFAPAEILDENSPIREGMRAVLAKHGGAS